MAASRIKGITVEIGGDTTGLQNALKGVNASIKTTQSALRDVNKLLKLDPSNTELLSQKQKLLKDAVSATSEKLESLKEAQEQAKKQLENGDLGQDKYDALQREIVETEQELQRLKEQAIDSNAALCKIAEAGKKLESVGGKISGVGEKLLPVTAGVTALGTASVKTTADFDTSMSQVQATMGITKDAVSEVNGETVNTMEALRGLAKKLGSETAFSASECGDALGYLALAGYDTQQMADTQLDNLSGQITILKSALEGLAISFGEILMPMVRSALEKIQAFVDKLNAMDDSQKQAVVRFAAVAAALGPLLIALGKTVSTVGMAMQSFSTLTKGLAKLALKLGLSGEGVSGLLASLAGAAGPILAVVAVIAVLVAAFKHLWDTNEGFRDAIVGIWASGRNLLPLVMRLPRGSTPWALISRISLRC